MPLKAIARFTILVLGALLLVVIVAINAPSPVTPKEKPARPNNGIPSPQVSTNIRPPESRSTQSPFKQPAQTSRSVGPAAEIVAAEIVAAGEGLSVRVLHLDGSPAPHHQVALYEDYYPETCSPGRQYWHGKTNRDGLVRVGNPESILDEHHRRTGLPDGMLSFKLDVHGGSHGEIRVRASDLKRSELTLRLPATASVQVALTDPEGSPIADANIYLNAVSSEKADQTIATTRTDDHGHATVERVAAGSQLRVGAWVDDHRWRQVESTTWQLGAGATATKRLRFRDAPVRIRGRLLDEAHQPFVTHRFLTLRKTSGIHRDWGGEILSLSKGPERYETDDAGRFVLALSSAIPSGHHDLTVFDQGPELMYGSTRFALGTAARTGVIDVGDIVVEQAPILFSGTATDDAGTPLRNARVELEVDASQDPRHHRLSQPDDHGRFVVRGLNQRWRAIIEVMCTNYISTEPIHVGAYEQRTFSLARSGTIRVSTLVDPHLDLAPLEIFVDGDWGGLLYIDEPELFEGISPGSHVIDFRVGGESVSVLSAHVRPGETTVVPTTDLRGQLREVQLTIQDSYGRTIEDGSFVRTDLADAAPESFAEEIRLITARDSVDLLVSAPGHHDQLFRATSSPRVVRLPRAQ